MDNFWVVTNAKYVDIVRGQLPDIPAYHILAEPAVRNTVPCITWACWSIKKEDPQANVVVTPADAMVMNPEEFRRVINNALAFIDTHDAIVTIGIKPSRPETGYGYVETAEIENGEIYKVAAFKEKPDHNTAGENLKAGNYLWNAGIFVWNLETIVSSITKYNGQIASLMDRIAKSFVSSEEKNVVEGLFPLCEKNSIDYAVMEPASKEALVYTHPADFGWSDLGNWASLHAKLKKDENNNDAISNVKLFECNNCVVHAKDAKEVVLQGLDGYIVREKNGRLFWFVGVA